MGRNGAQVTERDHTLLAFAAEHRLFLAGQLQVLLGISADAARARLRSLHAAGMLAGERFFHGQPPCWWITRKGLAVIDSPLPPPRIDLRSYRHDVGVGWVWLAAERGGFGQLDEVVSERMMRSRDGARAMSPVEVGQRAEPCGVRLGGTGPAGRERLHHPDLLLITPHKRRIAVELELTTKNRARRERILAGYGADRRIDAVVYLVDRPDIGRAVEGSAARLAISSMVHVQPVRWGSGREAGPGLSPSRSRDWSSPAPAGRAPGSRAPAPRAPQNAIER
jgi:hypothetical protein